jgi:hypothetical protein
MKPTLIDSINDQGCNINPKLKSALNNFFNRHPECLEGCIFRKDWEGADYALIIESSDLYSYMSGEFGWEVHTDFYETFNHSNFSVEKMNSCVIGFYKC